MPYNGWSNRATWNVSLWLNNDEGTYRELVRMRRRADDQEELAENIKSFCEEIWPEGKTPDGDLLRDADWEEIAAAEWDEDDHPPKTYDEAAERFGIGFECARVDQRKDGLNGDWDAAARHFRCRIKCGRRAFGLYFSQGSAHTAAPTPADVLNCLVSDAQSYDNANDFEDWCSEYGYDTDSRKAERTWRAVKKQAEQLKRTVGDKAYEALKECERL